MDIFNTQINKSTKFSIKVANFYKMLNTEHRRLLSIWEDEDVEQIIRELGTDAKALFELSSVIQTILSAKPDYEIIRPYKIIKTEMPKLDENNEPVLDQEGNVETFMVETKVFLSPTFKEDGSLDELIIV